MKLENLTNDPLVKDRIEYIFESFKSAFSNIVFVEEKSIIGIREPGKYFLCYFKKDKINNLLLVKFKAYKFPVELLCDLSTINACIKSTIDYFIQNDCSPQNKRTSTDDESADTFCKESFPAKEALLLTEVDTLLGNLDKKYDCVTFDNCSTRVRNVFESQHIFNVGKLKAYSACGLLQITNFGIKCLREVFEYLMSLLTQSTNRAPMVDDSNSEQNNLMLLYVLKANAKKYNLDTENAYDMYLKHSDAYSVIYMELMDYLAKISKIKLDQRSQFIFNERFGFNGDIKTLQEIGDMFSLSKERIRQLINTSIRKLKLKRISDPNTLRLEYDKFKTMEKLESLPLSGFLAYILLAEGSGFLLLQLFLSLFFGVKNKADATRIGHNILEQYHKTIVRHKKNPPIDKVNKFNKAFCDLIVFDNKRFVSDEAFSCLKTERLVNDNEKELANFSYEGESLPCESHLEKNILEKLLHYKTFKKVKTQSLKIPFKKSYYYPDFQCLTHDNSLVIIEVKPLFNMCDSYNIEKFQALKSYCEENGYGYLIVDDRRNSFSAINNENKPFNELLLENLKQSSSINFQTFLALSAQIDSHQTEAFKKSLITLAKEKKVKCRFFPFRITPYTD